MKQDTTQLRKETPTGRLLLPTSGSRADWLDIRRQGITATDLPAIMGKSKWRTAFDVYTDKIMPPDYNDNVGEAAFWGNKLEDPVALAWAELRGVKVRRVGVICHETDTWMRASLDRLVSGCEHGKCALEVKTRSLFVSDAWINELPEDVALQCHWQLIVSGLDHIHVAALIGGQKLVEHIVYPNAELSAQMISAAKIVWHAVLEQLPPNLPMELLTTEFLEQKYADRSGYTNLDPSVGDLVREYQQIVLEIKQLDERKSALRTMLVANLLDAESGYINGSQAYTYKGSSRKTIDTKQLKQLYPDVANDPQIWNTVTTRALRITMGEQND